MNDYLRREKIHQIIIISLRLFLSFLFIFMWEIAAKKNWIDSFVFSSPSRMIRCFVKLSSDGAIFNHIWITVSETLICFSLVMILSLVIAVILWRFKSLYEILEPALVLLNSLPKSALAPVLIVWLGNGKKTIIIAAASVAIFGGILSLYTSFINTDKGKIRLIETLGGKKRHILFYLVIPAALPSIISTMKVNLGLSLVGVIIGEFLAAKEGLGYLIIYGSQVFKMDFVMLSIVLLCILSIFLYFIISLFEKICRRTE